MGAYVTNKQICFVGIVCICIVSAICRFCFAVIILFANLSLSRVQTCFYISVIFLHNRFSFALRFVRTRLF